MRKSLLLAISLLVSAVPTAQAVSLKDCSRGSTKERMVCLQENIALLNKSHEAGTAELRKAVTELTTKLGTLTTTVDTLTTKVDTLTGQVNDLKGQIPNLGNIVIQWAGGGNSCITYMGNNLVQVVDTCVDPNRNRFVIRPYRQ